MCLTFVVETGRVLTTLVKDYYLLPGVEWTVLKEGETVEVTGRLSNGWYRCKAQRDARFRLDNIPTLDEATEEKGDDTERTEGEKEGASLNRNLKVFIILLASILPFSFFSIPYLPVHSPLFSLSLSLSLLM